MSYKYKRIFVPGHPTANADGWMKEHRYIAEKKLGRLLKPEEVVHHLDGDKFNNDPDNLIVFKTNADHSAFHKTGIKIEVEPNIFVSPEIVKTCPICKKEFYQHNSSVIYCSNECAKISQRKVSRPSKDELKELILSIPFTKIGKKYGVSDNAVRRWCKYYDLPYRKKDIENILLN